MIKAIETRYKGYRFRSRLEARWAVFFDAMGVEWSYEHEGYQLPSGLYLPDFWFPKLEMHAEVKPEIPTAHEWQLCKELCYSTKRRVVVLDGMPSGRNYWGWICYRDTPIARHVDPEGRKIIWEDETWTCYEESYVFLEEANYQPPYHTEPITFHDILLEYPKRDEYGFCGDKAIELARSARFGHGESGTLT